MRPVRWAVLGAATIARSVIEANQGSAVTSFTAVASRDLGKAREFASSARCFDAADEAGRMVVEGFMWRHHPQTALARRLLTSGAIGRLATIRAALTVSVPPGDIRRSAAMAGGALLDLGCYCVSAARLFGGRPSQVWAMPVADAPEPVDLRMAATMRLPGDVLALFDVGLDLIRRDELELVGTQGSIVVPDPWICQSRALSVRTAGGTEELPVEEADPYRIEFDVVSDAIAAGRPIEFGRDDAVEQAAVLEALARSAAMGAPVALG